jgi:hypothetical protein
MTWKLVSGIAGWILWLATALVCVTRTPPPPLTGVRATTASRSEPDRWPADPKSTRGSGTLQLESPGRSVTLEHLLGRAVLSDSFLLRWSDDPSGAGARWFRCDPWPLR